MHGEFIGFSLEVRTLWLGLFLLFYYVFLLLFSGLRGKFILFYIINIIKRIINACIECECCRLCLSDSPSIILDGVWIFLAASPSLTDVCQQQTFSIRCLWLFFCLSFLSTLVFASNPLSFQNNLQFIFSSNLIFVF